MRTLFLIALSGLALPTALNAQSSRYEIGLRLRDFERQLSQCEDEARRKAACSQLESAVSAYFRLDLRAVAEAIDEASWALRGRAPNPTERLAGSFDIRLMSRLVAPQDKHVEGSLFTAFRITDADDDPLWVDGLSLCIALEGANAEPLASMSIDEVPMAFSVPVADLPEGDHWLVWQIKHNNEVASERRVGLSVAQHANRRLATVQEGIRGSARDDTEGLTAQSLSRMLRTMTRKRTHETVLPGARMLSEVEALLETPEDQPFYSQDRPGEFWLRVPTAAGRVSLRMLVPEPPANPTTIPLVIAVHGAGGSENLFFDGYGDGEVVRQCQRRGWLLAAPRAGPTSGIDVPALIDALAQRYPVALDRVFVVGHSMGAAMLASATSKAPERYRAVALLGGGGSIRGFNAAAASKPPFFVAAGDRDFGRQGARQLHSRLQRAGATSSYREYPNTEHLTIVQIALPDVFTFFDEHVGR